MLRGIFASALDFSGNSLFLVKLSFVIRTKTYMYLWDFPREFSSVLMVISVRRKGNVCWKESLSCTNLANQNHSGTRSIAPVSSITFELGTQWLDSLLRIAGTPPLSSNKTPRKHAASRYFIEAAFALNLGGKHVFLCNETAPRETHPRRIKLSTRRVKESSEWLHSH